MIPNQIHADEHGFRNDVLRGLKRLHFTTMRYPGGNFASGYHWLDGVGPRSTRQMCRIWPRTALSQTNSEQTNLSNWSGNTGYP